MHGLFSCPGHRPQTGMLFDQFTVFSGNSVATCLGCRCKKLIYMQITPVKLHTYSLLIYRIPITPIRKELDPIKTILFLFDQTLLMPSFRLIKIKYIKLANPIIERINSMING